MLAGVLINLDPIPAAIFGSLAGDFCRGQSVIEGGVVLR
jgi:hypothetical protein